MSFLYNLSLYLVAAVLRVVALFNPKIKLFVAGRKNTFELLEQNLNPTDKVIWMHAASLGEYEQGLPILEKLKTNYPDHKFLLTFFSPSGYEVKKGKTPADIETYLPLDTKENARKIVALVKPKMTIFIKYEVWPNLLSQLKEQQCPTLLVSGIFNQKQVYFKSYGGFLRKALENFDYFFVQDQNSIELLRRIGYTNSSISGDSRYDRVTQIVEQNNSLEFMDAFLQGKNCIVAGSTWPPGEALLADYINKDKSNYKFVIAPHNIKEQHVESIVNSLKVPKMKYSELDLEAIGQTKVLILDTVGILTKVYSYADIAYVGGGFETGLHNTLEPAVFGIPVIIGPKYHRFIEAIALVNNKGVISVKDKIEFNTTLSQLVDNPTERAHLGRANMDYIFKNKGATDQVVAYINKHL
ncbi:3-deoxy-D-manno-octulosonic acid transferase [Croceivirga radicis]|uniref:3-deoxy-D-manno-octulosonic acid transferase n=1 Tax=Croceivirga radicis TaxID=1929488 RepID=UPI000255B0DD|nr:glycosyltransferase N-terminal domain-containing protein [Croceivirga radicis]